jgi:hypothetical protein
MIPLVLLLRLVESLRARPAPGHIRRQLRARRIGRRR